MKNKFTEILMTLLTIAFMAWAGVVWDTGRNVQETLHSFVVASEHRFTVLEKDVDDLKDHFSRHRILPEIVKAP